jgi:hypothetical protein
MKAIVGGKLRFFYNVLHPDRTVPAQAEPPGGPPTITSGPGATPAFGSKWAAPWAFQQLVGLNQRTSLTGASVLACSVA